MNFQFAAFSHECAYYLYFQMTKDEQDFLLANEIHGIGYLAYQYSSAHSFGKKTWPDVDSFHKAIERCKEHEQFILRATFTDDTDAKQQQPTKVNFVKFESTVTVLASAHALVNAQGYHLTSNC